MRRAWIVLGLVTVSALAACGQVDEARAPATAKMSPEQLAEAKRLGVDVAFENDLGMRFVLIPGGKFLMGSPDGENGRYPLEGPQHEEAVSPFYLATSETTNDQFRHFRPDHQSGSRLDSPRQPVVEVTHKDCADFAAWLGTRSGTKGARLPTEAEWEYACRAGTRTAFAFGETLAKSQANFANTDTEVEEAEKRGLQRATTSPVASFAPNRWGLYDMHGNVWEFCSDHFSPYPHAILAPGESAEPDETHVLRGGSWCDSARHARSARRATGDGPSSSYGFRIVVPLPTK